MRGIVVEAANAGDDERLGVEDLFAGGDLALHLIAGFAGGGRLPGEARVSGDVLPGGVEREGVLVEVDAEGVAAERVVGAGRVFLAGECERAARGGAGGERAGFVVARLRGGEAGFELHDLGELFVGGNDGALGVPHDCAFSLIGEVVGEIRIHGVGVVERHERLAAVKHHRAEVAEIGGREAGAGRRRWCARRSWES